MMDEQPEEFDGSEIAIVGMALRVPGANNIDEYWENLRDGVESIRDFSEEELRQAGVGQSEIANSRYVPRGAPLDGVKDFDASFFGFSPRDAAIMDPQHRHFLEVSWEALEHAGYDPSRHEGPIGVFGGSGHNVYMTYNLMTNPELMDSVGFFLVRHTSNDKDFLVTRVSYLFDLTGPAVNVQTACSTSLVAVHMGVQSLLNGESDMALAGGVTIDLPLNRGYIHEEGEILSRDGHCRTFDAESSGTIFGSGAGVVVLKRLDDALADRDTIHSIIRGTAINNDGATKVGYLAPSVDGQAAAVGEAIALAGINAESIGYIECHGTATEIGDPIEVAALTQAFRAHTDESNFCALGSVKTNIGHLDTAAGVASLIKATLALKHRAIPATVHFNEPNPKIDFDGSPFFVNGQLLDWESSEEPRRAGVSSLGVGGTNAHIILEEAPTPEPVGEAKPLELLVWSAKGPTALDQATDNLAGFLADNPEADLGDVAYTLRAGRKAFEKRRFAVVRDIADAAAVLAGEDAKRVSTGTSEVKDRSVVFMFPGQGAQYATMGRDLYDGEPVFRGCVDRCAELLKPSLDLDIRSILFPDADDEAAMASANQRLGETALTQPAIFTIEYAMATLWMSWGIQPTAMIGHSIGEYVAACVAGVFSLEDALTVIAARGRLMQELPGGSMLAVPQSADVVTGHLSDGLSLAARNGPEFSVVAGPDPAIDALQSRLEADEVGVRRLHTSHAFHSSMMEPMLDALSEVVAGTTRNQPEIPYVSNVTGTWITLDQISDPGYWAKHVRSAVNFVGGMGTILAGDPESVLLEVGPGRTLSTFAKQVDGPHGKLTVTSMRHPNAEENDVAVALSALGGLWAAGAVSDWSAFEGEEPRQRTSLPTYPFQHQEFWVEPGAQIQIGGSGSSGTEKRADISDWFYEPSWSQSPWQAPADRDPEDEPRRWLIFADDDVADGGGHGLGQRLAERFAQEDVDGSVVGVVRQGSGFEIGQNGAFVIDPTESDHYARLIRELASSERLPTGIAYLWPLGSADTLDPSSAEFQAAQTATFYGQLYLAQALATEGGDEQIDWWAVSKHQHAVAGDTVVHPTQALTMGPVRVVGQEYPNIRSRSLDISWPVGGARRAANVVDGLIMELSAEDDVDVVAHRGHSRWVQQYVPATLGPAALVPPAEESTAIVDGGVYLITGGLNGVGLEIADHLATASSAKLVLMARTPIPDRSDWDRWLDEHPENDATARKIRRLQSMESAGGEVLVVAADVTDAVQVKSAVAAAVDRFGAINGVFHAAGQLADGLVTTKEQADAAAVLGPKVTGTLLLERALAGLDLDFLALFSSTSAIVGTAGQIDYASANAFLNAYAQRCDLEQDRRTVAVGWGPWSQVGMTVRTAVELGLIDDADSATPVAHPLFDRWYHGAETDLFETEFSADTHWLLNEHRLQTGTPLLPGTGYIDLVGSAYGQQSGNGFQRFELSDVFFMAPFIVPEAESAALRTALESDGRFSVSSIVAGTTNEHASGKIAALNGVDRPAPQDLDQLRSRCDQRLVEFDRYEHSQLRWGPRWNNLRSIAYGTDEALATLRLPEEFVADLEHHRLHPALLDLATAGAQDLIHGFTATEDFFVPFSYGRLTQYEPLQAGVVSHIRHHPGDDNDSARFDIAVFDHQGSVLVTIEDFVMRRAAGDIAAAAGADGPEPAPVPLLESLRNGISNDEGMDALQRVLADRQRPEITVVAQDLQGLIRRAAEQSRAADQGSAGISHERPDLSTPYVEPTTDRQIAIAAIWEEMLGVGNVGIHDDFYELGGHSLLLTQLSTKVKKLSTADIPMMALFESSTIGELAEAIEAAEEEQGADGAEAAPKLGAVSRSAYRVRVGSLVSPSPGTGMQNPEDR